MNEPGKRVECAARTAPRAKRPGFIRSFVPWACLLLVLVGASRNVGAAGVLLGWSDTGLHETDGADVSVYSLFPPSSTVHAQLIENDKLVKSTNGIVVTFEAVADATGSINSTSVGKGNFFQFAPELYGKALAPDQGLTGISMPGGKNVPQPMTFDTNGAVFTAEGIPLTPYDDQGRTNQEPLVRLVARDATGTVVASTEVALPVSDRMDCRACHASGTQVAARPASGWMWDCDPVRDYKLNILRYHDDTRAGSSLYTNALLQAGYNPAGLAATVLQDGKPVLCLRCHASNALAGSGVPGMRPLTRLIHTKHAKVLDPVSGAALDDIHQSTACLRCHAGPESSYLRGVHRDTINPDGSLAMACQSCHGTLTAVGDKARQGWLDEPLCQNCHTGTATSNTGLLRYTTVYTARGTVRQPVDLTFATDTNSATVNPPLFRAARGHGGLSCAACHGSPHALSPSSQANESLQAQTIQGYSGTMIECRPCHQATPSNPWTGGPHGLHAVGQEWMSNHPDAADYFGQPWCATCHANDLTGTVLSLMPVARSLAGFGGSTFWRGFQLGCFACHQSTSGVNYPAVVSNVTTNTSANQPVRMLLPASDRNGDALTFRVVTQPTNGTASVSNNVVTFYPATNKVGVASFTFSAWDGWTDSNLGSAQVTISPGSCVLSVGAIVPTAALPGANVPFRSSVGIGPCSGPVVYDWDFGDGSAHRSTAVCCHTYPTLGDYPWKLTVTADGLTQVVQGVVTISPALGPPVILSLTQSGGVLTVVWSADSIPTSLEISSDPTVPNAWQPVIESPTMSGSVWVYQTLVTPDPQFFRVRRVP